MKKKNINELNYLLILFCLFLLIGCARANYTDAVYVSSRGKSFAKGDTVENPLKSLQKAVNIAKINNINKIIVTGAVYGNTSIIDFGDNELLICGIEDVSDERQATLNRSGRYEERILNISGNSNIVFENIYILNGSYGGIEILNGAKVTMAKNTKVAGNDCGIYAENGMLIVKDNAEISNNAARYSGNKGGINAKKSQIEIMNNAVISDNYTGIYSENGQLIISDNVIIRGSNNGIYAKNSQIEIMNNTVISDNYTGINTEKGQLTISDNVVIDGNKNGISVDDGNFIIKDKVILQGNSGTALMMSGSIGKVLDSVQISNSNSGIELKGFYRNNNNVPVKSLLEISETVGIKNTNKNISSDNNSDFYILINPEKTQKSFIVGIEYLSNIDSIDSDVNKNLNVLNKNGITNQISRIFRNNNYTIRGFTAVNEANNVKDQFVFTVTANAKIHDAKFNRNISEYYGRGFDFNGVMQPNGVSITITVNLKRDGQILKSYNFEYADTPRKTIEINIYSSDRNNNNNLINKFAGEAISNFNWNNLSDIFSVFKIQ